MESRGAGQVELFLSGDVMTGRGIDQILPQPSDPELRERHVKEATTYVALAERAHGRVPHPVEPEYIWGDALAELARARPDASIVNLETSVTASDEFWPDKGVHYRMHPGNLPCLLAARLQVCTLANNHVLDFGRRGLLETLTALHQAGLQTAGAGKNLAEAARPARVARGGAPGISVFACASSSSGVPEAWAAGPEQPGVQLLGDLSLASADRLAEQVRSQRGAAELAVVSIHWGSNWGFERSAEFSAFAHRLVERGVDLVHGHSSHHVREIEVYRDRLILYGCGDLITDYEGIDDHEMFRGDIGALYFATLGPDGKLRALRLVPMRMQRLRLTRAAAADAAWLTATLNRLGRTHATRFEQRDDASVAWVRPSAARAARR